MFSLSKIRNWIIPILLAIGGILDFLLEGLPHLAAVFNIDPAYGKIGTVIAFLVALAIAKLQPPSTNPKKLQKLVKKAEQKKKEEFLNNS